MSEKKRFADYIPILLVMLFWGSMGIPSTYAVEELTPLSVLCLRSGIGALFLFFELRRRHGSIGPAKGEKGLLFILALIGVVACNYLYFYAVQHTKLTHVAILYALGPVLTTILAAVFLKEAVHLSRAIGIVLAFLGVVGIISNGHIEELLTIGFAPGDIAELVSSLCLAVYTIMSKGVRKTPPDIVVFWLMAISFVITLPMVIFMEGGIDFGISLRAAISLLYLGILCSGLGYLLQQKSIQKIGASGSAAFLNGISPITVLTAALILGEEISAVQIIFIGVVFSGLYLNTKNSDWGILKRKLNQR